MRIPHIIRVGVLIVATTGFYTYVGQMVPQKEVQPPKETALGDDMSAADMAKIGREIMEGKGICLTCHTIGKSGALRFPDLAGIGEKAKTRVPGLSDVEYLAQSMYEPFAFVVPGFPPAMPPVNQPPIGLTDQEILCVIAALQTLGGTPTVTLKTTHKYYDGKPKPGAAPAAAPAKGAEFKPGAYLHPIAAHRPSQLPGEGALQARLAGVERGKGVPANDGVGGSGPPAPQSGFGEVSPEPALRTARAKADGAKPPGETGGDR